MSNLVSKCPILMVVRCVEVALDLNLVVVVKNPRIVCIHAHKAMLAMFDLVLISA